MSYEILTSESSTQECKGAHKTCFMASRLKSLETLVGARDFLDPTSVRESISLENHTTSAVRKGVRVHWQGFWKQRFGLVPESLQRCASAIVARRSTVFPFKEDWKGCSCPVSGWTPADYTCVLAGTNPFWQQRDNPALVNILWNVPSDAL